MPTKRELTKKQQRELREELTWTEDEFDVEVKGGPVEDAKDSRWIVEVRLGKRSVILREPKKGTIQVDLRSLGGGTPSTGTSDINEAIRRAEELLALMRTEALQNANLEPATPQLVEAFTIGDVERLLPKTGLRHKKTWSKYEYAMRVARTTLGATYPVRDITFEVAEAAIRRRMQGIDGIHGGKGCEGATAVSIWKNVSTCLYRLSQLPEVPPEARPTFNPLKGMRWPKKISIDGSERRTRKRRRKPFTLEQIMLLLLPFEYQDKDGKTVTCPPPVDQVDPTGALRLIIMIALFTGRRFEAILRLRVEDIRRTPAEMREALEAADDEAQAEWAEHFTHGLIDFKPDSDKESLHWPVPILALLRQAIDEYLEARSIENGWLFPAERDRSNSLAQSTVSRTPWKDPKTGRVKIGRFDRAWRLARKYLREAGEDPSEWMPIRKGYKMHRIRAFLATHLTGLGYGKLPLDENRTLTVDDYVCYLSGWGLSDDTRSRFYVPLNGEILMGMVEWERAIEVIKIRAEDTYQAGEAAKAKLARLGIGARDAAA